MKAVIYNNLDQNLLNDWRSLWEKSPYANYTNSVQWFLSVIETFKYKDYAIVAIYQKDNLVAIGALVKIKKYGLSVYAVVPEDSVSGMPFLVDPTNQKVQRVFCKKLSELGTVILENVPEEFSNEIKKKLPIKAIQIASNYYLDIKKNEHNEVIIRNKRRLLRRSEAIEKDLILTSFSGIKLEALNTVFAIDRKSNKNVYGYNAFSDKLVVAFYRKLQHSFQKYFSIYILYHKNKPIAYQLGFLIQDTFFCNQVAFLRQYEKYSIGRSLLIKIIEALGKDSVKVIDFGSGTDHVKQSLTKQQRNLYTVIIGKKNITGYLAYISKMRQDTYNTLRKYKKVYAFYRKIKFW